MKSKGRKKEENEKAEEEDRKEEEERGMVEAEKTLGKTGEIREGCKAKPKTQKQGKQTRKKSEVGHR